jgi:hypothetical protein
VGSRNQRPGVIAETGKIYMDLILEYVDWKPRKVRSTRVWPQSGEVSQFPAQDGRFIAKGLSMKEFMQRSFTLAVTTILVVVFFAAYAEAQEGVGIRAGVSGDPAQFYFGGHAAFGPVVEKLWFRPNVEVGVGNNLTLIALNAEFVYWTPIRKNPWNVYLGAGPAANIFSFGGVSNRSTDLRPGFNLLIGIAQRKGVFSEIKIGTIDSPSFKFGIGYTFPAGL